ncbi:longitudinals lacking protein, isoforms A/B/D/L-like [Daphnia carinata]|uniref:longitudinals lacking protein, isoforms A/B/D/L-like n=1 Tax=Daphnia carinata TaxID=120202 RepID=UPI00257A37A5|nr:longitudinals lacking protein, isoforms A/B/D/L-like [Daphnia carinata]
MDTDDEFCLKWNNHHSTFLSVLHSLLKKEILVDVTLAAEGHFIEAHKLVLSTCSEYFQDALQLHDNKHAYIFLNNVVFDDLKALVDYMYRGEVNVSQEQLPRFLATAEALKIKGLSDKTESLVENLEQHSPVQAKTKRIHGKSGKIASRQMAASSSVSRQTHLSSHQKSSHSITSQPQSGRSPRNLRASSDLISEAEVTPEVNFVSVNAHGEEIDLEQNEEDGLGTLGKVWSMNQGNNEDNWENNTGTLDDGTHEERKRYTTPSESDNCEYSQYAEPLDVNSSLTGDLPLVPSSSAHGNWASSSAVRTNYSRGIRGKSSKNNSAAVEDSWPISVAKNKQLGKSRRFAPTAFPTSNASGTDECITCPNCGRGYSQKGSLNRHIKFECGIIPKFPCQLCPMRFRRAYKLTEHHNRVHVNEAAKSKASENSTV